MHAKTLGIVNETGLPFLLIDEAKQHGDNFAKKFCNAIEDCFSLGYDKIIAIGSDCTSLSVADILKAYTHLQNNQNTVGADSHGGFYLLGLQKKYYQRENFLNFNWCSKQLFTDITGYLNTVDESITCILQNKPDLNTAGNLKTVIHSLEPTFFTRYLFRLCTTINEYCNLVCSLYYYTFHSSFALRGPPTLPYVQ